MFALDQLLLMIQRCIAFKTTRDRCVGLLRPAVGSSRRYIASAMPSAMRRGALEKSLFLGVVQPSMLRIETTARANLVQEFAVARRLGSSAPKHFELDRSTAQNRPLQKCPELSTFAIGYRTR
jgi:hypothetical protein